MQDSQFEMVLIIEEFMGGGNWLVSDITVHLSHICYYLILILF